MKDRQRQIARWLVWIAIGVPAIGQLALLVITIFSRAAYPYDLEWMEGGLLAHAWRIDQGLGLYVEPSIDFIPYLYTPLYPGLVATLGKLFGISYGLGRAISIVSTLAIVGFGATAIIRESDEQSRPVAVCGAMMAAGLFAAAYPLMDGWYDLVRADTLFLAMVIGGLLGLRVFSREPGRKGLAKLGACAAVLGLSFFCKQTGVLFVAMGGVVVLATNYRRLPLYVAVTGVIGLGFTALLNSASGGWFWTYVFEVHQAHDFNMDRFWMSFGNILWHFPALTIVVFAGLIGVAASWMFHRKRPDGSVALLMWAPIFGGSVVVGAIGWGTQWAHFNAYMPAFATGAIAAGAALPALVGAVRSWKTPPLVPIAVGLVFAVALAVQLATTMWRPAVFLPTDADRDAGDALVAKIRGVEGDVFVPFHNWYAHLAGKKLYVHRMGIKDVTYGRKWKVAGLKEAIAGKLFETVILDNRPVDAELIGFRYNYKLAGRLLPSERPFVYSGAGARHKKGERDLFPYETWMPARPAQKPTGVKVLFDFESPQLTGWTISGTAWGRLSRDGPLRGQGPVSNYGGRRYLTSFHGKDTATGRLESPEFVVEGKRLTFLLSGGDQRDALRAELRIGEETVATATGNNREVMQTVEWNVAPYAGQAARIVLIDEATGSWGHLNADEFWLWL